MNLRRTFSLVAAAVRLGPDALLATKPAEPWRRPPRTDPSGAPLSMLPTPTVAREPWCRWCLGPCYRCELIEVQDGGGSTGLAEAVGA